MIDIFNVNLDAVQKSFKIQRKLLMIQRVISSFIYALYGRRHKFNNRYWLIRGIKWRTMSSYNSTGC